MKKNIGVILAGGSGKRMGENIPKQFLVIAGKTVLEHTLTVFENHSPRPCSNAGTDSSGSSF